MIRTLIMIGSICLAQGAWAQAQQPAKPADNGSAAAVKEKSKAQQFNDERDELKAQYDLLIQKQRAKLAELEAEYNRINMDNRLASEKAVGDLAKVKSDLDRISSENKLADEKFKAATAAQNTELQRLMLDNKLSDENSRKAVADVAAQLARLKAANDLAAEKLREQALTDTREKNAIELEMKRMDLKERQIKIEKLVMDSRMDKLNADLALRARKEEWKKESNTEPVYTDKPFANGKLVISDRRIAMNGPIFMSSADNVTDRIEYFNNISSAPIFIVIDVCPGGSVMAGYRILKAMEASKAPVYVVVKSMVASMGSVITTMAERSYAYPTAVILHHQMSSMAWGNMTQMKEQLEMAKQWDERINLPVAKKMGVSLAQFRKMMYEKNSDGDWEEFGDKAVDYKWVTGVVERIEETGQVKNPDMQETVRTASRYNGGLEEKTDEKGQRYVQLPRLAPYDFYAIYNPDKYYR